MYYTFQKMKLNNYFIIPNSNGALEPKGIIIRRRIHFDNQ